MSRYTQSMKEQDMDREEMVELLLALPDRVVVAPDVELLQVTLDQDAELVSAMNGSLDHLATGFPWAARTLTEDDYRDWWDVELGRRPVDGNRHWNIVSNERVCGRLSAWANESPAVEFGFWVLRDSVGRGLLGRSLDHVRGLLTASGVRHFEIHGRVDNEPCRRVALRSGFTEVGTYSDRPSEPDVPYFVATLEA